MTATQTVDTIEDLKQVQPAAGLAVLVLRYRQEEPNDPVPYEGGGGIFRWDGNSTDPDNGGTTIASDPPPPKGRWKRVYDGPISVKFFGAWDNGTHPSDTREAIQAAIDFAINQAVVAHSHSASVVRFPARSRTDHGDIAEYAVDGPIVLPRLPNSYIVLRGDGQRVTQITRDKPGPLLICDQDPKNGDGGSYLIEHLCLAVRPAAYLTASVTVPAPNANVQIVLQGPPAEQLKPPSHITIGEEAGIYKMVSIDSEHIASGSSVQSADYLAAPLTVPAVNDPVDITLQGSNTWLIPNHSITIEGAGIYKVESIDPKDEHKARVINIHPSVPFGTVIAHGPIVQPADYLAFPFNVPALNDPVQISLQDSNTWLSPNHSITIKGAGIYMVESIDPNDEHKVTVKNTDPSVPLDTVILLGSSVQPADYLALPFNVLAINVPVDITLKGSNTWLIPDHSITIKGAGIYMVESIDPNDEHKATVTNTGAFGNALPGAHIASGSIVQPADYLAAPFTVPNKNAHVRIALQGSATWPKPNHSITIEGAGIYMVGSIDSGILATVTNTGAFGNAAPGTDIAAGSGVQPADYLAASFAVPAPNDHVQITLQGSNTWLSPNHIITIGGGAGIYMVESIDLNDEHKATVTNTGAFGNALPGGTDIAAGSDVQGELNSRAFDWTPPVDGDFSRPEIHFNEMLFVSLNNPIVGLVHIKRGHRCRFYNCEFMGLDPDTGYKDIGTTGVALWLENSGGTTIINSRNIYASGGLIKCSNGGELVMINCRCEGAKDIPAFDFQDVHNITLLGLATEGRRENPALFRFRNCSNVVAVNPSIATPDAPYTYAGGKHADGMLFQASHEFTVIQPYTTASFTQLGEKWNDNTARAIRITKDCRYGVIRGSYCGHYASDTDIEIESGAMDCYVEAFSAGRGPYVRDPVTHQPILDQHNQPTPAGGLWKARRGQSSRFSRI